MAHTPVLVSFDICPYVQRAAILLAEKGVSFERRSIDLSNPPEWFLKISPLGKVPVLLVGDTPVFESAVIAEYLEEVYAPHLHPLNPLEKARHRSWMEFSGELLGVIWNVYTAKDLSALNSAQEMLAARLNALALAHSGREGFAGDTFHTVDAFYGPVFRYFAALPELLPPSLLGDRPVLAAWSARLLARPSVVGAVPSDYRAKLRAFVRGRGGFAASLLGEKD